MRRACRSDSNLSGRPGVSILSPALSEPTNSRPVGVHDVRPSSAGLLATPGMVSEPSILGMRASNATPVTKRLRPVAPRFWYLESICREKDLAGPPCGGDAKPPTQGGCSAMAFELPPLPYAYDALEPTIDKE